jgi:hypothetical protein
MSTELSGRVLTLVVRLTGPTNSFEAWIFSKVFLLDNELIFGIISFFKTVEIWGINLGKPALYLIRGEYSRKSKRSTNVIKLGDLSVQKVETPL